VLTGRIAVVTGAAQVSGRAAAVSFAREGAVTWATDRNEAKLRELEGTGGIRTMTLDVTDADAIARAAARIGSADVLVNGVGWAHVGDILDCEPVDLDRSFDVNIRSMYLMIRAFLPAMIARRGGSIINIASVVSSVGGSPSAALTPQAKVP
jgi:NAD(P)-dependent dehydrogenase (short-subunit alcohol dehydrogenase family)